MRVFRPIIAAGFLALVASPAFAQDRYATIDVRAGYTFNSGVAGDSLKNQTSFGAGAFIPLGDRLRLGLTADWAHHSQYLDTGLIVGGPNDLRWNVIHAFLKASFDVVQSEKVTFALNAGPGIMFFSPNKVLKDTRGVKSERHIALNVGTTMTFWFAERIGLVGSLQGDFALKKTSGALFPESTAMMFPITGGFVFKI
jgi:hypothetical protein